MNAWIKSLVLYADPVQMNLPTVSAPLSFLLPVSPRCIAINGSRSLSSKNPSSIWFLAFLWSQLQVGESWKHVWVTAMNDKLEVNFYMLIVYTGKKITKGIAATHWLLYKAQSERFLSWLNLTLDFTEHWHSRRKFCGCVILLLNYGLGTYGQDSGPLGLNKI